MSYRLLRAYAAGVGLGVLGAVVLSAWQSTSIRPPTAAGPGGTPHPVSLPSGPVPRTPSCSRPCGRDADVRLVAHNIWAGRRAPTTQIPPSSGR
jgi:hypothetical protein